MATTNEIESDSNDEEVELDQPGLSRLREAVANYARKRAPGPPSLRQDGIAGLNTAISSVPDGMASGLLTGVNPVYGLYACILGPIAGGLLTSTRLMVITTTSAMSLMAGQILSALPGKREELLVILVVLIGAFQIVFGLLKFGRLTRFVSHSVMTGFLAGISVLLVLSQLPTATDYEPIGANRVTQTIDIVANITLLDPWSIAMTVLALLIAALMPQFGFRYTGTLFAIVVPSLIVVLADLDVKLVRDIGEIGGAFPELVLRTSSICRLSS